MKESLRTIILVILLVLAVGFVVWSSKQSEENLQAGLHLKSGVHV